MASRKLSQQQKRRIASQQQKLNRNQISSDDSVAAELLEGLVIARHSREAEVVPVDSGPNGPPCRCHIRANITDLVTGDRVMWRRGEPTGVVESVIARKSLMARANARGELRPVAANVDQIAIVIAAEPPPHRNLIDRYLVAIEHLNITPLLIANKIDLAAGEPGGLEPLAETYSELGYRVLRVSAKNNIGVAELQAELRALTTVFVGQSGVGKSSLINLLQPEAEAAVGDLSQVTKGRHTTTAARHYRLPAGGYLIDSPGIREFGLGHLEPAEIAWGFVEFRPYLGVCKFRNCRHFDEQGCAVAGAVGEGRVGADRWSSYRLIVNDMAGTFA